MKITVEEGVIIKDEGPGGNYEDIVLDLVAEKAIPDGVVEVIVLHDGWCTFRKGPCSCNPDVEVVEGKE